MSEVQLVEYKNNLYCVFKYTKKDGSQRLFVTDEEDFEKIINVIT